MKIFTLLLALCMFSTAYADFPNGRCSDKACSSSPYSLKWQTVQQSATAGGRFCFVVERQVCVQTQQQCCTMLSNKFFKMVLASKTQCNKKIANVTIDGVRKGGGVFFDLYANDEAELRITNLPYNITTGPGRIVCINTLPPCGTLQAFCPNNGTCVYSIFDPETHICCPTCGFALALGTAIPMLPSPPPSPSPRPPSPSPSPSPPMMPFLPATPVSPAPRMPTNPAAPSNPPSPSPSKPPPSPQPKLNPTAPSKPPPHPPQPTQCTDRDRNTCVCQCAC